jgi:UDP:flavonoid glycosyltransferase YjiC (YdhE family)
MNIILPTIGTRGDVQSYINLVQRLCDPRHQMILATNPTRCPLVEQHGIRAAESHARKTHLFGEAL